MSHGEGDLRARVAELERENAALRQHNDVARGRWMARGAEIARLRRRVAELESLVRGFRHCARQGKCANCEHFRGNDGCGLSLWERYDELFEEGGA